MSLDNKQVGDIELADAVFGLEPRRDILMRMVNYQRARRRSGTHKVKGRSEVAGSTARISRQKGTGRARQGEGKAPHFRGGGVAHGPHPRDHAHKLTKKLRRLAMRHALSAKMQAGRLVILDQAETAEAKTGALVARFAALGLGNALIVGGAALNDNFARAARNIPLVDVLPSPGANVYDILRRRTLVLTREAVAALEARLT